MSAVTQNCPVVNWYIVFFPGMALVLFTLGWNLVGDAVRDVLDPRMRKTR